MRKFMSGLFLIFAGSSGHYVLIGTGSNVALIVVGVIVLIWGLFQMMDANGWLTTAPVASSKPVFHLRNLEPIAAEPPVVQYIPRKIDIKQEVVSQIKSMGKSDAIAFCRQEFSLCVKDARQLLKLLDEQISNREGSENDNGFSGDISVELIQTVIVNNEQAVGDGNDRNLVDDLVGYFKSRADVYEVYFGMLRDGDTHEETLFLGVHHSGEFSDIRMKVETLILAYRPDKQIHVVSSEENKDIFELVKKGSFPFYDFENKSEIGAKLMKQWFMPSAREELIHAIVQGRIFGLAEKINSQLSKFEFKYFSKNGKTYILLYTHKAYELSDKDGLPEVTDLLNFNWTVLNVATNRQMENYTYLVNYQSDFELEINGSEFSALLS